MITIPEPPVDPLLGDCPGVRPPPPPPPPVLALAFDGEELDVVPSVAPPLFADVEVPPPKPAVPPLNVPPPPPPA